jgi:hypothetical protein
LETCAIERMLDWICRRNVNLLLLLREKDCERRISGSVTADFFFFFRTDDDMEAGRADHW